MSRKHLQAGTEADRNLTERRSTGGVRRQESSPQLHGHPPSAPAAEPIAAVMRELLTGAATFAPGNREEPALVVNRHSELAPRFSGRPLSAPAVEPIARAMRGLRAGAVSIALSARKERARRPEPYSLATCRPAPTRGPKATAALLAASPQSREFRP